MKKSPIATRQPHWLLQIALGVLIFGGSISTTTASITINITDGIAPTLEVDPPVIDFNAETITFDFDEVIDVSEIDTSNYMDGPRTRFHMGIVDRRQVDAVSLDGALLTSVDSDIVVMSISRSLKQRALRILDRTSAVYIDVSNTAIQDLAGNHFAGLDIVQLTVVEDTTAPTLRDTAPAFNLSTGVITFNFDDFLEFGSFRSIGLSKITITDNNGENGVSLTGAAIVPLNDSETFVVTLTEEQRQQAIRLQYGANTPIRVDIAADAFFDLSGNGNASVVGLAFTLTRDDPFHFLPAHDDIGIPLNEFFTTTLPAIVTTNADPSAFTYRLDGDLPPGMSFVADTRILSGTPTQSVVDVALSYVATVGTVTRGAELFLLSVGSDLVLIDNPGDMTFAVGQAVDMTLPKASGGYGDIVYRLTDNNGDAFASDTVPGLMFASTDDGGVLSGTPSLSAAGVHTLTYNATDERTPVNASPPSFTVTITLPEFTTTPPSGNLIYRVGEPYDAVPLPDATQGAGSIIGYTLIWDCTILNGATLTLEQCGRIKDMVGIDDESSSTPQSLNAITSTHWAALAAAVPNFNAMLPLSFPLVYTATDNFGNTAVGNFNIVITILPAPVFATTPTARTYRVNLPSPAMPLQQVVSDSPNLSYALAWDCGLVDNTTLADTPCDAIKTMLGLVDSASSTAITLPAITQTQWDTFAVAVSDFNALPLSFSLVYTADDNTGNDPAMVSYAITITLPAPEFDSTAFEDLVYTVGQPAEATPLQAADSLAESLTYALLTWDCGLLDNTTTLPDTPCNAIKTLLGLDGMDVMDSPTPITLPAITQMQWDDLADVPDFNTLLPLSFSLTYTADDNISVNGPTTVSFTITIRASSTFAETNEVILPEVMRAITNSATAAITDRIGQAAGRAAGPAGGSGASFSLAGHDNIASLLAGRGEEMTADDFDAKKLLAGAQFAIPLKGVGGDGGVVPGSAVFWASGEYSALDGEDDAVDWDGDLLGFQVGVDAKVRQNLLLGLSISRLASDLEYETPVAGGDYEIDMTSVHPYLAWRAGALDLWASVGLGEGDLRIKPAVGVAQSADLNMTSLNGGLSGSVWQQSAADMRFKGELGVSELKTDAAGNMDDTSVTTTRIRVALEASLPRRLASGASLAPSMQVGLRHDGGDGNTGGGVEVGGVLRYHNPATNFTAEGRVRALLAHSAEQEEWGLQGTVILGAGADGQGLSLNLTPSYGDAASAQQQLWHDGVASATTAAADKTADYSATLNSRVGYGVALRDGSLLEPYSALTLGAADTYRIGMRWKSSQNLTLNLLGERHQTATANNAIILKGAMQF